MTFFDFFTEHTFRVVLLGTVLIGVTSGSLGSLIYLRKQSLMSDVVGHSAIAGVMGAFLVVSLLGFDGRSMFALVIGSFLVGIIAVLGANRIAATSPVGIDSTMAIMLSLFFGGGMVLFRIIQHGPYRGKGGLNDYMFGNAAVITHADLLTVAGFGLLGIGVMVAAWKEIKVFLFDATWAQAHGFPLRILSPLSMGAVVLAIVVGMKAVGLVLMIAFAIIPPASARQWTNKLATMVVLAGAMGGVGAMAGTAISIWWGKVPTGPVIVLVLTTIFVFSLLAAPERSLLQRSRRRRQRQRELLQQLEVTS